MRWNDRAWGAGAAFQEVVWGSEKGLCMETGPAKHKVHVLQQERAGVHEDRQGGWLATAEGPKPVSKELGLQLKWDRLFLGRLEARK